MPEAVPLHVLDASIAVKWLLQSEDEPHLAKANEVALDFQDGLIDLTAPTALSYEVGHALTRAARRGRISFDQAVELYQRYQSWQIPPVDDPSVLRAAWLDAERLGCSFYDGVYLALARASGARWIHADSKARSLIEAAQRSHPVLESLWIEDYLPEVRPRRPS